MSEPHFLFRKATPGDVNVFLELEHTAKGAKTYSGIFTGEEALKEFTENEVYLIYQDDVVVGSTEYQMQGPEVAYLAGVVIHPDYQGMGIARKAALFRLEKLQGVKRIYLVTHPENEKIRNLYTSLGFTIERRIENYYGDAEPRLVLARNMQQETIP